MLSKFSGENSDSFWPHSMEIEEIVGGYLGERLE